MYAPPNGYRVDQQKVSTLKTRQGKNKRNNGTQDEEYSKAKQEATMSRQVREYQKRYV